MSGPEFFDPFAHGNMVEDKALKSSDGKVFSLHGHAITGPDDVAPPDFKAEINDLIDTVSKEGEITRAILILDGPDLGMTVRYIGDLDLSQVIGTLQIAGFVIMNEVQEDG